MAADQGDAMADGKSQAVVCALKELTIDASGLPQEMLRGTGGRCPSKVVAAANREARA